jgi:hypothetical protein
LRYGLVRHVEGHLPPAVQRQLLDREGCDILLEEGRPTRAQIRAQLGLLEALKPGDEFLVCSLDILQLSTGELVTLVSRLDRSDVKLKIVVEGAVTTVTPCERSRTLLGLLAANEALRPGRQRPLPRSRPAGRPLSRYQIGYAIELSRHGVSPRMIGLLFQISPAEVRDLLAGGGRGGAGVQVAVVPATADQPRAAPARSRPRARSAAR